MSKITNDGLTRSGTGCFISVPIWQQWVSKGLLLVTYNLFLGILVGAEKVDGLHVTKVDVMSQQEDEQQFTYVFLLLITIQRLITLSPDKHHSHQPARHH